MQSELKQGMFLEQHSGNHTWHSQQLNTVDVDVEIQVLFALNCTPCS